MTGAEDFAQHVRERGYPHSGAIEAYGARHVPGSDPETWMVDGARVELTEKGVFVEYQPEGFHDA